MLIPLLHDVAGLALTYAGVPAFPLRPEVTLGNPPADGAVRGFLPSALPTLADLKLQMAPALQTPLLGTPIWSALITLLLIPALDGLAMALFLGLLGDAVAGRPLSWRRALQNWPAFAALGLAGRLACLVLPMPVLYGGTLLGALFFPALPFAIGVLNLPLAKAFLTAPDIFWSRFWRWLGYGLLTGLITFLATFVWSLAGANVVAAFLVYPLLATGLVGGAIVLALDDAPATGEVPQGHNPFWVGPAVTLTLAGAAWLGAACIDAWADYQPTREAALSKPAPPPFAMMFPAQKTTVAKVLPQPEGSEVVLSRVTAEGLGVSVLRRNRFGWKQVSADFVPVWRNTPAPAVILTQKNPLGDGWFVAGELLDPRVALLDVDGRHYLVDPSDRFFAVRVEQPPKGQIIPLDAAGQPVPDREVKQP